jgi:serine O-acetyltransferase
MESRRSGPIAALRRDIVHYQEAAENVSPAWLLLREQGLWALVEYRLAHASLSLPAPRLIKRMLRVVFAVWRKVVEITTGISISAQAEIGPGLYIGHFGGVFINGDVRMGEHCAVMQGVNIVMSWSKRSSGAPVIGNNVYFGPKCTVAGPISVGDGSVIAANSLVTRNVPPGVTVRGVPAEPIIHRAPAGPDQGTPPPGSDGACPPAGTDRRAD